MKRLNVLILLLAVVAIGGYAESYNRKHIHVIVDQTKDVQQNPNISEIYNTLCKYFTDTPDNALNFNPQTDELSLYVFAIDGRLNLPSTFNTIHSTFPQAEQYKKFNEYFIRERGTYDGEGDFHDFLNRKMKPLFSNQDVLAKEILQKDGLTLSKYVYPAILNKFKREDKTAVENIIIIVTNFQSGLNDLGTSEDTKRLDELLGPSKRKYFESEFDKLEDPFYLVPLAKEVFGSADSSEAAPMIYANRLALKSLQGLSVYITSNLQFVEKSYNSTSYDLENVDISFNYDENDLKVDSIIFFIKNNNELIFKTDMTDAANYDDSKKTYKFGKQKIELPKVYNIGDSLKFEYVFYTRALDDKGETIMPLAFVADRDFVFGPEHIVSYTEDLTHMIIFILIFIAIIAIASYIGFRQYKKRGLSREVDLSVSIIPVSNERFMEVKNRKVLSYDCWYWKPGDRMDRNIHVIGELKLEDIKFAYKYNYRIEAQVQDIDTNEDFTFKPNPQKYQKSDGSPYLEKEWVPLECVDGHFSFDVLAYFDGIEHPDFSFDNVLKMLVKINVIMTDSTGKDHYVKTKEDKYSFIIRPKIANSDLWVAFDPGTTGSCIAYGIAGSPTDRNDLFLAENESELLDEQIVHGSIFPSKIRISSSSEKLFGAGTINAEDLVEDDDFVFGNTAVIMSRGTNGVNTFQSIKKLLGYTTNQKIKSKSGETKEIPGKDLAHLIVKGLYNHFESYLRTNPNIENSVRQLFFNENRLQAHRAIVAVPNNYTLVKIQDMVDSVKRTNKFEEVHYIYESEAVFMMYLRKNWRNLEKLQNKVFVVYDMGGATINATAFRINVNLQPNSSNIRNIEVTTIAKIGYGVGGDDIDFALIQFIYGIPSFNTAITSKGDVLLHQRAHKEQLIAIARDLKYKIIDYKTGTQVDAFSDAKTFYGHLRSKIMDMDNRLWIKEEMTGDDEEYLAKNLSGSEFISRGVLESVADAMKELLISMHTDANELELILSGRSVLYPKVRETVLAEINLSFGS